MEVIELKKVIRYRQKLSMRSMSIKTVNQEPTETFFWKINTEKHDY